MKSVLARLRHARQLRQCDVAVAVGVDQSAVAKWETGASRPSLRVLPALADVLSLTDAQLGELVRSFRDDAPSEAA